MPKTNLDARERIVSAARALLEATGPAVISMREVARRAQVSVGTVSYHFPDKEQLLEECLDVYYDKLDALWEASVVALRNGAPVPETAERLFGEMFDVLHANRNMLRVRIALAMARGFVPHSRLQQHLLRYVDDAQPLLGVPSVTLRLRFHSVYVMLVRHCAMAPDEWVPIADAGSTEEAVSKMRSHLVDASLGILDMRPRSPQ